MSPLRKYFRPRLSTFQHRCKKPFEEYEITLGNEVAIIKNMGQAHTSHDLIVYLTKRKILITGDTLFVNRHPAIFESQGSDADKWIEVLNVLIKVYPGAVVIPGHGDISDESAIVAFKEYFEDIKNAVGDKTQIKDLRKKYKHLSNIPFMSGFDKTLVHFQKKANQ